MFEKYSPYEKNHTKLIQFYSINKTIIKIQKKSSTTNSTSQKKHINTNINHHKKTDTIEHNALKLDRSLELFRPRLTPFLQNGPLRSNTFTTFRIQRGSDIVALRPLYGKRYGKYAIRYRGRFVKRPPFNIGVFPAVICMKMYSRRDTT